MTRHTDTQQKKEASRNTDLGYKNLHEHTKYADVLSVNVVFKVIVMF